MRCKRKSRKVRNEGAGFMKSVLRVVKGQKQEK